MPDGVRKGRLWLRGVRMQQPHAQVPTSDLYKDLPLWLCVSKPSALSPSRVKLHPFITHVMSQWHLGAEA